MRSFGIGNRATITDTRMDELFPEPPPVLRDDYKHVLVRRDGHLLEVTINRPEARNSLHPEADEEPNEVFDACFAGPTCGSRFSPAPATRRSAPGTISSM